MMWLAIIIGALIIGSRIESGLVKLANQVYNLTSAVNGISSKMDKNK
jgi:hypothetical protein